MSGLEVERIVTPVLDMLAENQGRKAFVSIVGQEWAYSYAHYSDQDRDRVQKVLYESKVASAPLARDYAAWIDYWRTSVWIPEKEKTSFRKFKKERAKINARIRQDIESLMA